MKTPKVVSNSSKSLLRSENLFARLICVRVKVLISLFEVVVLIAFGILLPLRSESTLMLACSIDWVAGT